MKDKSVSYKSIISVGETNLLRMDGEEVKTLPLDSIRKVYINPLFTHIHKDYSKATALAREVNSQKKVERRQIRRRNE